MCVCVILHVWYDKYVSLIIVIEHKEFIPAVLYCVVQTWSRKAVQLLIQMTKAAAG